MTTVNRFYIQIKKDEKLLVLFDLNIKPIYGSHPSGAFLFIDERKYIKAY